MCYDNNTNMKNNENPTRIAEKQRKSNLTVAQYFNPGGPTLTVSSIRGRFVEKRLGKGLTST